MTDQQPLWRASRIARWGDVVHVCVFVGLVWLPLAAAVLQWRGPADVRENRALARAPRLGDDRLASVPALFERYYNDHFGLRSELIWAHDLLRVRTLGVYSSSQVVVGHDDWLFLAGDKVIEDHQGLERFTPEQLHAWQEALEGKQAWLAARGIGYLFVVAPNKESVYPDRLPSHLQRPGAVTLLDQLSAHLARHSRVEILDLRGPLREASRHGEVYFPLDTHWNDRGALWAYRAVCGRLKAWFPAIEALGIENFRVWRGPGFCDLCPMIGWHGVTRESEFLLPVPRLAARPAPISLPSGYTWPPDHPSRRPVATERPGRGGRLLMFHDSFAAHCLRDYLAEHFGRCVFLSMKLDFEALDLMVRQERPQVVVEEWVERTVRQVPVPHPIWTAAKGDAGVVRR